MTSDAKIGLLLGLVFIFAIAFIINGLPSFLKDTNNNELTTNMVNLQNNPPGIAARERKAREALNRIKPAPKQRLDLDKVQSPSVAKEDIRFRAPLPKSPSAKRATKMAAESKPSAPASPLPLTAKKDEAKQTKSIKPALPKVYAVKEGDSLWRIAAEQLGNGSRYREIFRLNTNILDDEDSLSVGMRLRMPAR